jgi:hypothetical protein
MNYYAEVKTYKVVGKVNCFHLVLKAQEGCYSTSLLPGTHYIEKKGDRPKQILNNLATLDNMPTGTEVIVMEWVGENNRKVA